MPKGKWSNKYFLGKIVTSKWDYEFNCLFGQRIKMDSTLDYNLSWDGVIPKLTRALIKINGLLCFTQRFVCFCSNLFKFCQKYIKLTFTILEKKNQLEFCKNDPMPATSVSILALVWQINIWDNISFDWWFMVQVVDSKKIVSRDKNRK